MTYAKYINNEKVELMSPPKHISNPTSEQLANYAAACGYKELRVTEAPSPYHTLKYREYDEYITTAWYAPALESLKASLKEAAQAELDTAIAATTTLDVEGVGSVLYNQLVATQLLTLETLPLPMDGINYTLADDSVVSGITLEQVQAIKLAGVLHIAALHEAARAKRAAIDAAETVEELLEP